eukprot:2771299-Karenia_brevis.AAC.1
MSQQQSSSSMYVPRPQKGERGRRGRRRGGRRREKSRGRPKDHNDNNVHHVKISSMLHVTMPGSDQDCMSM